MTSPLLMIGVLTHALAPLAAAVAHRSSRTPWHATAAARRAYDALTIVAAAIVVVAFGEDAWRPHEHTIQVATVAAVVGALLPIGVWRLRGDRAVRRRPPAPGLALLIPVAAAEEAIWRAAAPTILLAWGVGAAPAALCAASAFAALHLVGHRGLRRLPYVALVTSALVCAYALGGLASSVLLHVAHNLVVALLRPAPLLPEREERGVDSAVTW